MAGETGTELVNSTTRITEGTLRLFIELMKFIRERARQETANRDKTAQKKLQSSRGAISNDKLMKLAQQKKTTVVPMAEKLSLSQRQKIVQKCAERGIPVSIVAVNKNGREIKAAEKELARLDKKGDNLRNQIADIDRQRKEYCDNVDRDGGTVNDKVLKDFDRKRAEKEKALNELEFLSDEDKGKYHSLYTKLHGDPENGIKGLYAEREEACINYCACDAAQIQQVIAEVNLEHGAELCNQRIQALEDKERNGTLTDNERDELKALREKGAGFEQQLTDNFNQQSKEEVFKSIADNADKTHEKMDFAKATNRMVGQKFSGKNAWIFDPKNPTNYIKVTKNYNEATRRTEHTYDVFKNGEVQTASERFGTNGVFTDKYSKNGKFARYIDEQGNDTTADRGTMYWTALRNEMSEKADLDDKSVFVFYNENEFNQYLEAYKEAEQEISSKQKEETYDLSEEVELDSTTAQTLNGQSRMLNCQQLIEDTKESIDEKGYQFKYGFGNTEPSFKNRTTGETYTISDLKNDITNNVGDIGEKAELLLCGQRISKLCEIYEVQAECIKEGKAVQAAQKEADTSVDTSKLESLTAQKETLIAEYENLGNTEVFFKIQKDMVEFDKSIDKSSDDKDFSHGEKERAYGDGQMTMEQWQQTIDVNKEAKAMGQATNETIKTAEHNLQNAARQER